MAEEKHVAFLPFLVAELSRLHAEKRSGTLFATTMHQRLAQFGLDHGEVVYLSFQNVEGHEGLKAMAEQRSDLGASRFADGRHRGARLALPTFGDLIRELVPGAATPPRSGTTFLDDRLRKIVEDELADIIGPYAGVICQDCLAGVITLEQALIAIARELDDQAKSEKLFAKVMKALG